jgi:citrate lyase subunit beta/citryl-CoA lyase
MAADAPLLRSLLFVPGDQPQMQARARLLPADGIILDLEDGVAAAHKPAARSRIRRALEEGFPDRLTVFVRPNARATGLQEEDLLSVLHPRLYGVMVPKIDSADDVAGMDGWLRTAESQRGIAPGGRWGTRGSS